nr:MAG TPA: hypothetical protein [Caudoviricetes sp.]
MERLRFDWPCDGFAMLGASKLGNGKATHGEAERSNGIACQGEAMA